MKAENTNATGTLNYEEMGTKEKKNLLFTIPEHVKPEEVEFKINADALRYNCRDECYRELMVSYIPMLPLLEKTVPFEEADYILYMHPYARCEEKSEVVVRQIKILDADRKAGAKIIVVGKAVNAEKLLNGEVKDIIFWGDHFTEKLGKMFGFDIKEQYFVYDDEEKHLAIWPVDGCLNKCKFCRRTYMDIKFESLSLETIKENLDFFKRTAPEKMHTISLRAENITEYGIDIYGRQMLHKVIELVDSYDEVVNIKFDIGMCIGEITPEILDALCKSNKTTLITMSLETGSNRLLKLIGKKHTREYAIHVFKTLREAHPDIEFESTVMVGLPTEELVDMEALADLIIQTKPNYLFMNSYVCTKQQPLAQLPQLKESSRAYHIEFFIKTLWKRCQVLRLSQPWKIQIAYEETFKRKKDKRSVIKLKKKMKKYNETHDHFFPRHYVSKIYIDVFADKSLPKT